MLLSSKTGNYRFYCQWEKRSVYSNREVTTLVKHSNRIFTSIHKFSNKAFDCKIVLAYSGYNGTAVNMIGA